MGPLEATKPWMTAGLVGVERFLERVWAISEKVGEGKNNGELVKLLHKTIKKVTHDTSTLNFNTGISAMMVYSNELAKLDKVPVELWEPFVKLIAPYAPHLGEELWQKLGHDGTITYEPWPAYDEALAADTEVTIVAQVNGKVRDKFTARADMPKDELEKAALALPNIKKWTEGKQTVKIITVPGKLVNIVCK
jgi:leucyl-tRNA synthetase